jgi:hypothetical protein
MQFSPTSDDFIPLWLKLSPSPENGYALDKTLDWSREGLFVVGSMEIMIL